MSISWLSFIPFLLFVSKSAVVGGLINSNRIDQSAVPPYRLLIVRSPPPYSGTVRSIDLAFLLFYQNIPCMAI